MSANDCAARCASKPHLCASDQDEQKGWGFTMWSEDPTENPPFRDFGKVLVDYCSIDLHAGTREPSDETNGYFMHVRHIIEAVMDDIIENKPDVDEIVDFNCDFVDDKFHAVNMDIDVRCIANSGDFYPAWFHPECCYP